MRRSPKAALAALLVLGACSDATGPTTPQVGYYPLRNVDGQALPAARVVNGHPLTVTGGFVYLRASPDTFAVSINYHAEFQDSVLGWVNTNAAIVCRGTTPSLSGGTTVTLTGTDPMGWVGCLFEITGQGTELSGHWADVNRGIWNDPAFGFGPRQDSPPAP